MTRPRLVAAEETTPTTALDVLTEALHEMLCRRRHPHPTNHSYSMMAGQLQRALDARRSDDRPDLAALREALKQIRDLADLSLDDMRSLHGSEQRVLMAVIPSIAEAALAARPVERKEPDVIAFAKALFKEIPLCTGCDFDHAWNDHVHAVWNATSGTAAVSDGPGLDVERLAQALHVDCHPYRPALAKHGVEHHGFEAKRVAAEYAHLASASTSEAAE